MKRWCILIHQIPPKPLYLRAKIRQQLARIGAVSLKNSVYVVPLREDAVEDMQWVAQEITTGGGQAFLVDGRFLTGVTEAELIEQFNTDRSADYARLRDDLREAAANAPTLARMRQRFKAIRDIDFFDAPSGKEIDTMLQKVEARARTREKARGKETARPTGRTWVTRRGVKVDRIASAWLIRRYIDPEARFRFVDPDDWKKKGDELSFDITGGDYTHAGNRCTFETLLATFRPRDAALRHIAEIVHDIDLKDERFGRPDAAGIRQLIEGLISAHARDDDRLERGFALFDDLHRSFQRGRRGRA